MNDDYYYSGLYAEECAEAEVEAQQPVAWITPGGDVSRSFHWCLERCLPDEQPRPLYAAPQPAEGEEIMVNTARDVYTLPLQPSGLTSGPRFVVHVPEPEQQAPHPAITHCDNCGCDWLDNGLNPVGCPYCKQNAWRAAFISERTMRYIEGGMAIEQARIHAETDTAFISKQYTNKEARIRERGTHTGWPTQCSKRGRMKMTDKATASDIWLPPLAAVEAYLYINGKHRGVSLDYRFDADLPEGTRRIPLITAEQADDYARAAVLADRKRRGVPVATVSINKQEEYAEDLDYGTRI